MIFLGREISEERDYGEEIANAIDGAVHGLIQNAYNVAKQILTENHDKMVQIAEQLIVEETIEGDALNELFDSLIDGSSPKPPSGKTAIVAEVKPEPVQDAFKKSSKRKLPGDTPPEPLTQA